MWYDPITYVPKHHTSDTPHSHMYHDTSNPCIHMVWCIHICTTTHSIRMCHDNLMLLRDMPHSYMWYEAITYQPQHHTCASFTYVLRHINPFTHVTCLIHICTTTHQSIHTHDIPHSHMYHDSPILMYHDTFIINVWHAAFIMYVSHAAFIINVCHAAFIITVWHAAFTHISYNSITYVPQPVQSCHSTSNSFMHATYCSHICAATRPILMCHKIINNSPSFFLSMILGDTMIIWPYTNVHT